MLVGAPPEHQVVLGGDDDVLGADSHVNHPLAQKSFH